MVETGNMVSNMVLAGAACLGTDMNRYAILAPRHIPVVYGGAQNEAQTATKIRLC